MNAAAEKDILEGITDKTPKLEIKDRLTQAAGIIKDLRNKLGLAATAEQREMDAIKKRVRVKYQSAEGGALLNVIVGSSDKEWTSTQDFLAEFDGILPPPLQRLQTGIKVLFDQHQRDSES